MKKRKAVGMSMDEVHEQTGFCKRLPDEPREDILPLLDLPACEPSPHEAQSMADLITPFQREEILDLCRQLKTKPAVEVAAMFGNDVSFWQLHTKSADVLIANLRTLLAFQMAYKTHNAPDHDRAGCLLCAERKS